jgi:RNA polymerase subunit RPABC4/transcription elongation factor Spt4
MPKQTIFCRHCHSGIGTQAIYRRETIPHSKRCRWIRIDDLSFCPACGSISVWSIQYQENIILLKPEENAQDAI